MSVAELLHANGIRLHSTAPGHHYAICPQCSAKRSTKANRSAKCLGITIDADGAYWTCNHCGWRGSAKPAKANGRGRRDENLTTYDYVGDDGELLYQKVRNPPGSKPRFWLRRPDGRGGWINERGKARRVIYRLPEVIEAIASGYAIVVAEGEKDCNNLWRIGIPATCSPDGASEPGKEPKWRVEYSEMLRGADLVVTGDADDAGRAHMEATAAMSVGIAARVRVLDARHWHVPPKGKDVSDWLAAGHSREEFDALVALAPDYGAAPKGPASVPATIAEWDVGEDSEPIAPREWLLGDQFCRTFLSSVVAPGGTGKTALRMLQFISLAIGRALTGQHVFRRSRPLIVSLEDNREEARRRFEAARIHYNIDREELKGWLFCAAPKKLKIAEMVGGSRQIGILEKLLREAIDRRRPDLLSLDPFVKTHALEENDNGAMDYVCDLLTSLGDEYNIAIDAPHHARKGTLAPGDADMGRGASGIKDAGRLVNTLIRMNEDEAASFNISAVDARWHLRLDNAKVNIAPPGQDATWFKLVNVRLGNATADYPNGDHVQTVEPWTPPKTWAGLSNVTLNAALTEIDAGMPNGQRYSGAASAKSRAAWRVVQRHCPDKTEAQCREIIRVWLKNEVLFHETYDDPINRHEHDGLRVNHAKRPGSETAL